MSLEQSKVRLRQVLPLRERWKLEFVWATLPLLEIIANPVVFLVIMLAAMLWISETLRGAGAWKLK